MTTEHMKTHHMKMAKASKEDIDYALHINHFLDLMNCGYPASDAVADYQLEGYDDLVAAGAEDKEFLLRAFERGSLFRVAFGLQVLLDPRNEIVDPDLTYLELHPKLRKMEEQSEMEIGKSGEEIEAMRAAVAKADAAKVKIF